MTKSMQAISHKNVAKTLTVKSQLITEKRRASNTSEVKAEQQEVVIFIYPVNQLNGFHKIGRLFVND